MAEISSGDAKRALGVEGADLDVIRSAMQRYFDDIAAGGDGFGGGLQVEDPALGL